VPPIAASRRRLAWSLAIAREALPEGLIVFVTGRLGAPTSARLATEIDEIVAAGHCRLLIDLSGVDYLSSAGLAVIEQTAARLKALGGIVVLSGLQEPVRVSFEVSGAAGHLSLVETVDEGRRRLDASPVAVGARLS
jgi:anti-anti-sigma factor